MHNSLGTTRKCASPSTGIFNSESTFSVADSMSSWCSNARDDEGGILEHRSFTGVKNRWLWMPYLAMAYTTFCSRVPPWYLYCCGFKWPNWMSKLHCGSKSGHSSLWTFVFSSSWSFTASMAYVTEIRLAGLVVLRDVIEVRTVLWFFYGPYMRIPIDICYISWPRLWQCASLRATSSTYYCCPHACILLRFDAWNFGFCCSRMCCSEGRWKNGSYF